LNNVDLFLLFEETGIKDYQINEEKKTVVYKRYYHVFKEGEMEDLLKEIEGFKLIDRYFGKI
jgi:alkylated DNA repair protein alkB family protein 8